MTRTLYFVSGSPFAWRVMLALAVKGLEYDTKLLSASEGDTQKADFLKLNPRGRVPVLVDGDVTVYESIAILAYLDRAYPDIPLIGKTSAEAAVIWQRLMELDNYLAPAFVGAVRPVFTQQFEGREAEINENFVKIRQEIATVNGWLASQDFMAGDTVSALDVSVYPPLALLRRVRPMLSAPGIEPNLPDYEKEFPKLALWMKRVEALPGFDAAYPPHWREAA